MAPSDIWNGIYQAATVTKYTFDYKSLTLAERVLDDAWGRGMRPEPASQEEMYQLAQAIQDCVDGWVEEWRGNEAK